MNAPVEADTLPCAPVPGEALYGLEQDLDLPSFLEGDPLGGAGAGDRLRAPAEGIDLGGLVPRERNDDPAADLVCPDQPAGCESLLGITLRQTADAHLCRQFALHEPAPARELAPRDAVPQQLEQLPPQRFPAKHGRARHVDRRPLTASRRDVNGILNTVGGKYACRALQFPVDRATKVEIGMGDDGYRAVRKLYETRGFAHRTGWGKRPAVLVVDLTNGFTDPASPLGADLSEVLSETNRLLAAARRYGVPVIFTSIAYDDPDLEGGHWVRKIPALRVLRVGTAAIDVDTRLERRATEPLIYKKFTSAFFGTHLQSMLQCQGIDTLVICGASTSGCIRATVADGIQYGFRCIVPQSAVGDRAEEPHRANLFDIDSKYGDVMALNDVLTALDQWAPRDGRLRGSPAPDR